MKAIFHRFAQVVAHYVGTPAAFVIAAAAVLAWGVCGPIFGFSDTWQLTINTATTIITFLVVFLIQETQNRDAQAMHLKLDELIHAIKGARNRLVDLEDASEEEIEELKKEFARLHHEVEEAQKRKQSQTK
jgi:low affinity Fe/Cu permease